MAHMRASLLCALLAAVHCACGHDDSDWSVRDGLRIERRIGGRDAGAIDAALLRSLPPDHADAERKAWRLARLFEDLFADPRAVLEAVSESGEVRRVSRPAAPDGDGVLVLGVNRRGGAFLDVLRGDDLAAAFHGRGGNRGRGGDPDRLRGVVALRLVVEGPARPAAGDPPMLELAVVVDGEARVWSDEDLAGVEALSVPGDSGEGQRDAWSLRALVHALVGPAAAATQVQGEGGRAVAIPPAAWADGAKTPVLRLNRRGQLKFHWVGPDLAPLAGEEIRQVSRVTIRTR
jgi:hypothetical protein